MYTQLKKKNFYIIVVGERNNKYKKNTKNIKNTQKIKR